MRRAVARHLLRRRVAELRPLARVRLVALHLAPLLRGRLRRRTLEPCTPATVHPRVQGVAPRLGRPVVPPPPVPIARLVVAVRQMRRAKYHVSAVLRLVVSSLAVPHAVVVDDDLDRVHRDVAPPVARVRAAVVGQRVHEVSPG